MRRFFGWLLVIIAVFIGVNDWRSTAQSEAGLSWVPFGTLWNDVHTDSLQQVQPAIERYLSPWLWDNIMRPILHAPAAWVLGGLGILLLIWWSNSSAARATRKRRQAI